MRFIILTRCVKALDSKRIIRRAIYSDKFLYIDKFRKNKLLAEKSFKPDQVENLKSKSPTANPNDLKNLFYLANNREDFQLALSSFKKYLNENSIIVNRQSNENTSQEFDDLLFLFCKSFYVLKLKDLAKSIMDDVGLKQIHKYSYPSLVSMNLLLIEREYDCVYDVFEKCLKFYPMDVRSRKNVPSQDIPFSHLTLVCESLLLSNDSTSVKKLEKLLDIVQMRNSKLNHQSSACCVFLLIKQNKLELAKKVLQTIANNTGDEEDSIYLNLNIILLAKMNDLKQAFKSAFKLLKIKPKLDQEKVKGRLFPLTLLSLKQSVESMVEKNPTDVANQSYLKKYDYLEKACILQKRLCKTDLIEFCTKMKIELN